MTPNQAMRKVTKKFADEEGISPYEINNGYCVEWAEEVLELLRNTHHKVELWETPFGYADTTHAFVRINGKFYDSECLEGVDDHMELPIFAKLHVAIKRRQAVWLLDHNKGQDFTGENKRDMTDEMVAEYNKENGITWA